MLAHGVLGLLTGAAHESNPGEEAHYPDAVDCVEVVSHGPEPGAVPHGGRSHRARADSIVLSEEHGTGGNQNADLEAAGEAAAAEHGELSPAVAPRANEDNDGVQLDEEVGEAHQTGNECQLRTFRLAVDVAVLNHLEPGSSEIAVEVDVVIVVVVGDGQGAVGGLPGVNFVVLIVAEACLVDVGNVLSIHASRGIKPDHIVIVHLLPVLPLFTLLTFPRLVSEPLRSEPIAGRLIVTVLRGEKISCYELVNVANLIHISCEHLLLPHAGSEDEIVEVGAVGRCNTEHKQGQADKLCLVILSLTFDAFLDLGRLQLRSFHHFVQLEVFFSKQNLNYILNTEDPSYSNLTI